jgi:hypothetical protein
MPNKKTDDGVDKRLPHSDGHLDQDQSGRSKSIPGQGGTEADPSRSGQVPETPSREPRRGP